MKHSLYKSISDLSMDDDGRIKDEYDWQLETVSV